MTISVERAEDILFGAAQMSGEYSDNIDDIGYHDVWDLIFGWGSKDHVYDGFTIQGIETEGGSEGEGEHTHMVFLIKDEISGDSQYFRIDGYYSSYEGTSWDGELYPVVPTQRLVTFYESV